MSQRRTAGTGAYSRFATPRALSVVLVALATFTVVFVLARGAASAQLVPVPQSHPLGTPALTTPANPDRPLEVHLSFSLRDSGELERLLAQQQNFTSSQYHHWLTPQEFNARFRPSHRELEPLRTWLVQRGFRIESESADGMTVVGTVAAAESAFGTSIATSASGAAFANTTDAQIPSQFSGLVANVSGLDNLTHLMALDATVSRDPEFNNGIGNAFGPADLYTFYDESPLLSAGVSGAANNCVALIEDSDYLDSAVSLFVSTFSLPALNVSRVLADKTSPGRNGDENETLLDIEWAHAVAPGAPIVAYLGSGNNGLVDAIRRAVSDNACGVISVSFSFCGAGASFYTSTLDPLFAQAASQGQSVFIASGDQGAAGLVLNSAGNACMIGNSANVSEMAADPHVTAVGGTEFNPNYANAADVGNVAESAWNDATGASGGGVSRIFAKPEFQQGATPNDGMRDVPDVAFAASPFSPGFYWATDDHGSAAITCCIGGTSIAAPMWAGLAQLIAQSESGRLGSMNSRIYALGTTANPALSGIRDVVSGNNDYNGVVGFDAVAGFDQVTGWGSADMATFAAAYPESGSTSPTSSPTPTAAPTSSAPTLHASRKSLSFPAEIVIGSQGITGPARTIELFNPSTAKHHAPINLSSISAEPAGEFTVSQPSCGSVIEPGTRCSITVAYTPSAAGPQLGTVTISSDAANSSLQIGVKGRGKAGKLRITSRAVHFNAKDAGEPRTITLTNPNPLPISIAGLTLSDTTDYALGGTCGASIAANGNCQIAVSLRSGVATPSAPATLSIDDDAADSPQVVMLMAN